MPDGPGGEDRWGITVVEVLVALIIVAVGVLAMAGSAALALRTAAAASRQRAATHLASSRIARLAAAGCSVATNGATPDPLAVMQERWTTTTAVGGMQTISARVQWPTPQGRRALSLTSALPC